MKTLYTIGHSNRIYEDFLQLLQTYNIAKLIDIRISPTSRRLPWFNQQNLSQALAESNIQYFHIPKLGGRRSTSKNSVNTGWESTAFRGYADYMQTDEFFAGLEELNNLLDPKQNVAIMCAEALPWQCHRTLVSDAEVVRGIKVLHILSNTSLREHKLTDFAVVNETTKPITLYYPPKNFQFEV